ncbi:MAG: LysM peptidoglycan-binding domain-containing protein [Anaerolineae bacterium]|nr:LysM peptidoglycan-binding domain-containing protein [Anaerolineae bacterium]
MRRLKLSVLILLFIFSLLTFSFVWAQGNAVPGQTHIVTQGETLVGLAVRYNKPVTCLQIANELPSLNPPLQAGDEIFIPNDCSLINPAGIGGGGVVTAESTAEATADASSALTPTPESTPGAIPLPALVIVQPGDRLARIAEIFNVSLTCLVQINNIANPDLIFVGQQILVTEDCVDAGGGAVTLPEPVPTLAITPSGDFVCRFDRNPGRIALDGLYTVQAGDALDFIACDFNVALECLIASNPQLENRSRLFIGDTLQIDLACPPWRDSSLPAQG